MSKYWLRIGFAALLIFGIGLGLYALGRNFYRKLDSAGGIPIPLLGVPFKLDGEKIGSLRSLVIRRNSGREITRFELRARLTDSAAFERMRSCRVSVSDLSHVDERTSFVCLASDSGYQPFGEVRLDLRHGNNTRTLIAPLLLPQSTIREFHTRR